MQKFPKTVSHRLGESKPHKQIIRQICKDKEYCDCVKACVDKLKKEKQEYCDMMEQHNYSDGDMCIWF